MADSDPKPVPIAYEEETEAAAKEREEQQRLRYLEFVHLAAIQALLCMAKIYAYAKESAGPLKSGVQSVEGTVRTVVGPVVDKYHDAPLHLLKIVDRKVDESVQEFQRHVPSVVKEVPAVARSVASEVHKTGLVGSAAGLARSVYARCEPSAKEMIAKYAPAAEQYAASAWRSLNGLPLVPKVAQVVVPAAAQMTERYNRAVCYSADKGYAVSNYLPLVPTERIAKVFAADAAAAY